MTLRIEDCNFTDEMFSFKSLSGMDNGRVYTWNITKLVKAMRAGLEPDTRITIPVDESLYNIILHSNGVEPDHLKRITEERLKEPIIVIEHPDHTNTIIDGSHRLVKNFQQGNREVRAYLFKLESLEPFRIEGNEAFFGAHL